MLFVGISYRLVGITGALAAIGINIVVAREVRTLIRVERKCRARVYRQECLNCGVALHESNQHMRFCFKCLSKNDDSSTK